MKKVIKIGNTIFEIPETSSVSLEQPPDAKKFVAERGDEVKPIESLPAIPNPNDFIGSSMFQAHAIGRVGTSNKKWVNTTGMLIFAGIPIALMEAVCIFAWVSNGRWIPFVIVNAVLAFILGRKDNPVHK